MQGVFISNQHIVPLLELPTSSTLWMFVAVQRLVEHISVAVHEYINVNVFKSLHRVLL
jgi:hypothetical protein